MHHLVYKTTNLVSGTIYIGVHSTENLNDEYLGSGIALSDAINKYGSKSFKRETLFEFDTREEAFLKEAEIVTEEFVKLNTNYNISLGGGNPTIRRGEKHHNFGKKLPWASERMRRNNPAKTSEMRKYLHETTVGTDIETGVRTRYSRSDPRWKSGQLVHLNSGRVSVRDESGKVISISVDDPRWKSGKLKHSTKGLPRSTAQINKWKRSMLNTKCPYCGKLGAKGLMHRWHFDNCKDKHE